MGYNPQQVGATNVGTTFGYTPQQVQAGSVGTTFGYNPQNVQAQQAAGGINTYMNPYTQGVIDTSMADLERQRQMQQNQIGAQATQAGAFGGSRQGVAEALTNEAFARQGGQLAAGLRQQGFQTALGAAQQDAAANMQAQLANQAAQAQAAQFGQGTTLQAQQANQQAGLQSALANQAAQAQASQFGQSTGLQAQQANQSAALQAALANQSAGLSGASQRLGAAGQMSSLAGQGFNFGQQIGQQQAQQGAMQRAMQQSLIDAARQQFAGYTGYPQQALNLPLQALGMTPYGSTTTAVNTAQPGLMQTLGNAAQVAALFAPSDPRLKTNVKRLGEVAGFNIYVWDWNEEGKKVANPAQPTLGVMADELQETHPHLVHKAPDGYLRVDYAGLNREING
jgi:hypothetical protein